MEIGGYYTFNNIFIRDVLCSEMRKQVGKRHSNETKCGASGQNSQISRCNSIAFTESELITDANCR